MKSSRRDLSSLLPSSGRLPDVEVPAGRIVDLPGRGTTFITDSPGPTPDAPAILLLHALSTTGLLTWFPSIPALTERFRVITMDQRLHGRGIQSPEFSLRDCADDAAAVLDALDIDQAVIAGYSMGSLVTQRVWRQHPDRVGGLVLCAGTDQFQTNATERLFHRGMGVSFGRRRRVAPTVTERTRAPLDPEDDLRRWAIAELRSTRPLAMSRAVAAIGQHHTKPWVHEINVPTAVVIPLRDKAIPPERQRAMAQRIPGATVHEVDAGHSCCVMRADLFVPKLIEATNTVLARWTEKEQA
ncbi:alpha/beta hydrolase [Gordonia sp. HY002]|uniref:alpha/beta fold hydrolase n=1 Tax=Gordonia zhenghanii TaxID=2911516 RepID=UPI001EF11E21|nr:alpha/beta fold hydrolase [Gordonia zhenghanii]MCF8570920.1 alpha/beta hydrolase [Gordonia zhenghanii]MCF8607903.1 alpha/beta hydrolase [Gordonia zhenghanii]